MPTKVPYVAKFIYIGPSANNLPIAIPYPSLGLGTFTTSRFVDSGRNAAGVVVGTTVGRSNDKQNMKWNAIDHDKWVEINRFIESNGMFFWCKYYNFNTGRWLTRPFYCGDVLCDPFGIDTKTGEPMFVMNAQMNVIDTGG